MFSEFFVGFPQMFSALFVGIPQMFNKLLPNSSDCKARFRDCNAPLYHKNLQRNITKISNSLEIFVIFYMFAANAINVNRNQ